MKIIALNGLKNSSKVKIAHEWAENHNVSLIPTYTSSKKRPEGFIWMDKERLTMELRMEKVLTKTQIDGELYCHFKRQLDNDFNIILVDDDGIKQLQENYNGRVVTVWVDDPKGEESERFGKIPKDEYDFIYDINDDSDEFLEVLAFQVELVE